MITGSWPSARRVRFPFLGSCFRLSFRVQGSGFRVQGWTSPDFLAPELCDFQALKAIQNGYSIF